MASLARLLLDKMRMLGEDAAAVSRVVEDAFQGHSEVDDELLDKDLRQVFYDLQDERILDIRRVEVQAPGGPARRHYLWHVREDPSLPNAEPRRPDETERLYLRLSETAWERKPLD